MTSEHLLLGLIALLTAILVYFYPLTNFALHIDGELMAGSSYASDVAIGRWGIALLHRSLLAQAFVPFFTPFLSLVLVCASALTIALSLDFSVRQRCAFVAIYVACPQFAWQLEFPFQSDCVAFGVLCATVASLPGQGGAATWRREWGARAGRALLLAFGVSFYQSIVLVPLTIGLLRGLLAAGDRPARGAVVMRPVVSAVVLCVAGYAGYAVLTRLVQWGTGIGANDWLDAYESWGRAPWMQMASVVTYAIWQDLAGRNFCGNFIYLSAWVAAGLIVVDAARRGLGLRGVALVAATALVVVVSPFVLVAVLATPLPARIFLGEPTALAGLWAAAIGARRAVFPWLLSGFAVIYGSYQVSRLFYANTMSYQADLLLGNRIVSAIYAADPAFDAAAIPVYFSGAVQPPNIWRGDGFLDFGGSFFAWDGGNTDRIVAFLKAAGIAQLHKPKPDLMEAAKQVAVGMPAWPNPASVRLAGGVLVVKLGE